MEITKEIEASLNKSVQKELVKRIVDRVVSTTLSENEERINHYIGETVSNLNQKLKFEMPQ